MLDGFPNQTILKLYSLETYFDLAQMYLFKAMHGKLVKSTWLAVIEYLLVYMLNRKQSFVTLTKFYILSCVIANIFSVLPDDMKVYVFNHFAFCRGEETK